MGNGVYMQAWMSHFVIAPPLIITKEEIDRAVAAFDEALSIADSEVRKLIPPLACGGTACPNYLAAISCTRWEAYRASRCFPY